MLILSRSDDFLRIVQSRDSRVRYRNGQLQIDDVCRHQLVITDDVGFAEALDRVLFGDINGVCVADVVEIVRINHPGRYHAPKGAWVIDIYPSFLVCLDYFFVCCSTVRISLNQIPYSTIAITDPMAHAISMGIVLPARKGKLELQSTQTKRMLIEQGWVGSKELLKEEIAGNSNKWHTCIACF